MYRGSSGYSTLDDQPRRPERWDRDRFERARGGDNRYHQEEYDRWYDRDRSVGVAERDRCFDDDRYARRPDFDDHHDTSQALQPYTRRKSIVIRDNEVTRPRRPAPLRRHSSLDTFDRKPRRYDDHYRPPKYVDLPLPYRKRRSPSPPRERYHEEHEKIMVGSKGERYRDVSVHRSKSRRRKIRAHSVSSSNSSEAALDPPTLIGKRGKTRMPKRLVQKEAIIQMGLPYEEEGDFYIVQRALAKEHIDEVIKITETIKRSNGNKTTTTTYKYEKETENTSQPVVVPVVAPAPAPAPAHMEKEVITRKVIEEDYHDHHGHHHYGGPLVIREPQHRSDREILEDISALEAERHALQRERDTETRLIIAERIDRDHDHHRHHHDHFPREVIRVEKDSRGRMALVRSSR